MTPEEKDAYRHLLYCALLEIRSGRQTLRWWSLSDWRHAFTELPEIKGLADDFHNLAFFSREDFRGFDPLRFWSDLERLSPARHSKYRRIFDGYMNGSYSLF